MLDERFKLKQVQNTKPSQRETMYRRQEHAWITTKLEQNLLEDNPK